MLSRNGSTEELPAGSSHSHDEIFWRRAFPSFMMVAAFVLLYEATVSDSRYGFAGRAAER